MKPLMFRLIINLFGYFNLGYDIVYWSDAMCLGLFNQAASDSLLHQVRPSMHYFQIGVPRRLVLHKDFLRVSSRASLYIEEISLRSGFLHNIQ